MKRDGHAGAEAERVVSRQAARAKRLQGGLHAALDAELEDLLAESGEQRLWPVERNELSVMHDRHAVGQALGLVEVVRGHEDRHGVARSQLGDHVEQLMPDARVKTDGRLIEEQHLRPGNERARDFQPPALPAAVAVDLSIDELGDAERLGELLDPAPGALRFDAP